MSKYDQCEHRLPCGTCIKTGKICPHLEKDNDPYRISPFVIESPLKDQVFNIPDCCVNCPNHPHNGGSGICNCVLPYMNATNVLQSTIVNNGNGTYTVDSSQKYNGEGTVTIPNTVTVDNPKIPHTYTDSTGIPE